MTSRPPARTPVRPSLAAAALSVGLLCAGLGAAPADAAGPVAASPLHATAYAASTTAAPTITTQPQDTEVVENDDATFTAASADYNDTVQWETSTDGGVTWTPVDGATAPATTFRSTTADQDGTLVHAVFASADDPSVTTTTDSATLTVDTRPTVVEDPAFPDPTPVGQSVTLTSTATGRPTPTQQWKVSHDGGDTFEAVPGATESTYTFTPTRDDDGAIYEAVFTSTAGSVESGWASLSVADDPARVTSDPQDTTVEAGTDATFTVGVAGDPAPDVQWQVLESWNTNGDWSDLEGATGTTYTVPKPTLEVDGNQYRAVLTTENDYVESEPATLHVTGTAPGRPEGVTARQTGTGQVTVSWTPPSSPGNSAISSYVPGWSGGEFGSGDTVGADQRSHVFTGLETGRYTFSVSAANLAGPGERASATPFLVLGTRPSFSPSAYQLVSGQGVRLTGLARPGSSVSFERAYPGGAWATIGRVTAAKDGSYTLPVTASRTATYRTRMDGGTPSYAQKVVVASRVTASAVRTATRTYTLRGSVLPAVANQLVTVYAGKPGGTLSRIGTDRTNRYGAWSLSHRFPASATYAVKVVSAATSATTSGTGTTTVSAR